MKLKKIIIHTSDEARKNWKGEKEKTKKRCPACELQELKRDSIEDLIYEDLIDKKLTI
jgi:hypothetical protein